jgi:hypothetical protein
MDQRKRRKLIELEKRLTECCEECAKLYEEYNKEYKSGDFYASGFVPATAAAVWLELIKQKQELRPNPNIGIN